MVLLFNANIIIHWRLVGSKNPPHSVCNRDTQIEGELILLILNKFLRPNTFRVNTSKRKEMIIIFHFKMLRDWSLQRTGDKSTKTPEIRFLQRARVEYTTEGDKSFRNCIHISILLFKYPEETRWPCAQCGGQFIVDGINIMTESIDDSSYRSDIKECGGRRTHHRMQQLIMQILCST